MNVPLILFVAIPLGVAFALPLVGDRRRGRPASWIGNATTLALLILALLRLGDQAVYRIGRWTLPLGINLVLDGLSGLMLITTAVVAAAVMVFSVRYMDRYTARAKFLSLLLLMVTGMNGVILSGDLFNLFVFLEIASIASYALVAFGCDHEELEAGFKYMVLGSVASMFILLGVALTYGLTGALNMAYAAQGLRLVAGTLPATVALAFFIVGFGLKAALVPFHAWLPDAHPAAPAPISAMLSGVLIKVLGVYAMTRVVFNVFGITTQTAWVLVVLGVVSMVAGGFLALGQWDIKRLMAYSSISQVGYIVMGLGLGGLILAGGGSKAAASLAFLGAVFHLVNHAVYKSLLFLTSGSLEMATGTRNMQQLGGLAGRLPWTRTSCTIGSAAIAGIPPFSGFWSKLVLVIAAVQGGYLWLGGVIVFVSVLTLVMYLKVQRHVFLGECPAALERATEPPVSMHAAMGALAVLCVVMGLLLLVPGLREAVLEPAAAAVVQGVDYAQIVLAHP